MIVAGVPEEVYSEAAIARGLPDIDWVSRRAVGHEAVIEHFMRSGSVLPMQLFTLFTSDERALGHVARDRRRIGAVLTRIKGKHEWGLRLTWDERMARRAVEKAHAKALVDGSAYLARKRDLLDVNRTQLSEARTTATTLFRRMTKHAADAKRRTSTE